MCGSGAPGVHVRVVAHRDKPDRCVFQETQVVEERRVRVGGANREAVTLECKLQFFCFIKRCFINPFATRIDNKELLAGSLQFAADKYISYNRDSITLAACRARMEKDKLQKKVF